MAAMEVQRNGVGNKTALLWFGKSRLSTRERANQRGRAIVVSVELSAIRSSPASSGRADRRRRTVVEPISAKSFSWVMVLATATKAAGDGLRDLIAQEEGAKPTYKPFKEYQPGFLRRHQVPPSDA